ncbi:ZC4H2-like protein [Mya arenaria]|uniref:ZC4H2-like protein n=1 Tax=Mya arenaria TaxID=6604 RepID=A0ABY7DQM4_MYAAR|nr:ZC4H2-like protein [Mya arenaria]
MEGTIKQAEEERNRSLDTAKQLYEDYRPLKTEVDSLQGRLGLQPLPDIQDEDENITPQCVFDNVTPKTARTAQTGIQATTHSNEGCRNIRNGYCVSKGSWNSGQPDPFLKFPNFLLNNTFCHCWHGHSHRFLLFTGKYLSGYVVEAAQVPGGNITSVFTDDSECPYLRWGDLCENKCGHCLDDYCYDWNGYCKNGCESSYKTTDMCLDECEDGRFGKGCFGTCGHCLDGLACNKLTGYCDQGCAPGWTALLTCKQVSIICDQGRAP